MNFKIHLLFFILLHKTLNYSSPDQCTANTSFYNVLSLTCATCPANTIRASDMTYCNCSTSYYPNPAVIGFNDSQACLSLAGSYTPSTQVASIFDTDGTLNPIILSCADAYPDSINTKCIPCGKGMTFSSTLGCVCSTTNTYRVSGKCYTNTNTSWTQITPISNLVDYLAQQQTVIGCQQNGLVQSCNILINRCVFYQYASSNYFCGRLNTLVTTKNSSSGLPTYSFSKVITDSLGFYASSILGTNTTSVRSTLNFYLAQYTQNGSLNDIRPLDNSIMPCKLTPQDINLFSSFGLYFSKKCTTSQNRSSSFYYDLYVLESTGKLAQVPVKINGSYYKRFRPIYNSLELQLTGNPSMTVPVLVMAVSTSGSITTTSSGDTSLNYMPFFGIAMAIMGILFFIRFYRFLKYNPDQNNDPYYCFTVLFYFIVVAFKYVACGIWVWLLSLTGFVFLFYKLQQTIYLSIPPQGNDGTGLYKFYESLFFVCFTFTIVAIFITIFRIITSDYFIIDWQKEKQLNRYDIGHNRKEVSVWRKVLLVNQLFQLSMTRLVNIEMVSLFSLLFLAGLNWIGLSAPIGNTSISQNYNAVPFLAYFLIAGVISAVSLGQIIVRYFLRTWFPLPFQNFIDLCSVTNISLIMFDQALHGYYIHGMNPVGQSEGSLDYIESMFEKQAKSFGKSRAFRLDDVNQCQTFQVIFPIQIRKAFQIKYKSRYIQKLTGKGQQIGSLFPQPVPNMNQQDYRQLQEISNTMLQSFKFYLQGVKTSNLNIRERGIIQKALDFPVDTQNLSKLPVFFKDSWNQFTNLMLSGHEFLLVINYINFVNIFFFATQNIYYSFFISFIIQKIFNYVYSFFIRRNISKNTLIDDKFFT